MKTKTRNNIKNLLVIVIMLCGLYSITFGITTIGNHLYVLIWLVDILTITLVLTPLLALVWRFFHIPIEVRGWLRDSVLIIMLVPSMIFIPGIISCHTGPEILESCSVYSVFKPWDEDKATELAAEIKNSTGNIVETPSYKKFVALYEKSGKPFTMFYYHNISTTSNTDTFHIGYRILIMMIAIIATGIVVCTISFPVCKYPFMGFFVLFYWETNLTNGDDIRYQVRRLKD